MRSKEFIVELKISDNDVKRIIKDRLAIDAETGVDAMKLAIDKMANIPKTSYVQSQASQLMMLYKQAKMSIGGEYFRKLNKLTEDQHPNERPKGPETKPTMPKGTVKVDVSDVYDWYKLGQHISDLKGLGKHDFGKGPPSAVLSFGDEDEEHKYIKNLKKTGLTTTDIDPKAHEKKKGQKTDPTYNVGENFADGRNPGRKGLAKRVGVNCKASVSSLRKTAKNSSGEKRRMAHWCANMKSGK